MPINYLRNYHQRPGFQWLIILTHAFFGVGLWGRVRRHCAGGSGCLLALMWGAGWRLRPLPLELGCCRVAPIARALARPREGCLELCCLRRGGSRENRRDNRREKGMKREESKEKREESKEKGEERQEKRRNSSPFGAQEGPGGLRKPTWHPCCCKKGSPEAALLSSVDNVSVDVHSSSFLLPRGGWLAGQATSRTI